jgi:hypothetical protein
MKTLPISNGYSVLIDDEDLELVQQFHWQPDIRPWAIYAMRTAKKNGKQYKMRMHRLIMGVLDDHYVKVDHKNGNGLDNRKENLRVCSNSQNLMNSVKPKGNNRFKGVYYRERNKKFQAMIKAEGKRLHLGLFTSEEDAARAYNDAALTYFGEFAKLNVIP